MASLPFTAAKHQQRCNTQPGRRQQADPQNGLAAVAGGGDCFFGIRLAIRRGGFGLAPGAICYRIPDLRVLVRSAVGLRGQRRDALRRFAVAADRTLFMAAARFGRGGGFVGHPGKGVGGFVRTLSSGYYRCTSNLLPACGPKLLRW